MRKRIFGKTIVLFCMVLLFVSCNFFNSFSEEEQEIQITSLTLAKSNLSVSVGEMSYIAVSVKPTENQKDVVLTWTYDKNIISIEASSWGATITGLKEGQTNLKCSYNGYEASSVITVKGFAETYEEIVEPYIYSNTSIIQTAPGVSEKVFVSLYGGTAADIDGYSWTIDNPSVAKIEPTGQYCMITAKEAGYARIKITHSKATYPYYMGIYVFEDATNIGYITTPDNILTMNLEDDERTISVNLINGKKDSSDSSFSWEIINEDSNSPINYETNGNKAVITPVKAGSCTIRVTHPDSAYPLDILCRVISVVKNVYIEPDNTVITLSGTTEQTVKSTLKNIDISEYDIDGFTYSLDDYNVAEIIGWVGDEVMLKGKANGSCKLIIGHEKSKYTREVLVIVNGQLTDAIDASCYITTSQNYIRTKVGNDETLLNISLKGGEEGDEQNFQWSVKSTAFDGSGNDVISIKTTNGTVGYSRAAAMTFISGQAYIEPKYEGTAVITITHPKIVYPTEVLVKVLSKEAVLEEPLYFTGDGLLRILNGSKADYTVQLKGKNKTESDDNEIMWSCDNSLITISANGNFAEISAPPLGTGNTISYLNISHNKSESDKKVMILTADTEEELANIKALYSDKLYYNIGIGDEAYCMTNSVGFDDTEIKIDDEGNEYEYITSYDFSSAVWTVKDSSICSIEKDSFNHLTGRVVGLKAGTTTVTVSITEEGKVYSCSYEITVYPEGAVQTEPEVYFTTSQNVINLSAPGKEKSVNISAINLSSSKYTEITWTCENESIANVVANGESAIVTAVAEGETIIYVSHPDSQNTLKIYVRVGSEYVSLEQQEKVYISSQDVITLIKGENDKKLTAELVNWNAISEGFNFVSKDTSIAKISSQSTKGIAYIEGISKGYTEVLITHTATKITKSVLVVVGNSAEEIEEILKEKVYLSTENNTISFNSIGASTIAKIKSYNLSISEYSNIQWTSENEDVARVIPNGISATISAVGEGITTIIASHPNSINAIKFSVFVGIDYETPEEKVVYISSQDVITMLKDDASQRLDAILVNSEADKSGFSFTIDNENVATISSQSTNGIAYIKPIGSGQAEITITHPKSEIDKKVLVVVGNSAEELAGYTYLTTGSNVVAIGEGNTKTVSVSVKNSEEIILDGYTWTSSDPGVVSVTDQGSTAVFTGNSIGTAIITVTNKSCSYPLQIIAQCVDPIAAAANPFIQLTSSVLTLNVSSSYSSITADLVGGTEADFSDFVWTSNDTSVCAVYGQNEVGKIRALQEGTAYITVSHPKAAYPAQILVVCDKVEESECYISVPSSIINMKPTDSAQTITASLINGTITDKYNFTWSLDVYDVIDLVYSANVCTIEPKQQGQATITIHHPKSAYDQQIVVTVQEYTTFAFPQEYVTITQGTVSFETMQVPNTKVSTYVKYSSSKEDICTITGTNTTAQITAVSPGTTTVRAELIASSTGVVQASAEMMVYVKEAPSNACYITSSSTIYTVQKGKSQTLSANLTGNGVITSDQQNLKWSTNDTDKISIAGIKTDGTVTGQSIYLTAVAPGEALITCSHEKAASDLQFFVVVPGSGEKIISFNKSYITLVKGSSGTTLKVNIENAESTNDYGELIWTVTNVGDANDVCRVMGQGGQNVTIYPVNVGEAEVMAQLPDSSSVAKCTVKVEAGKSFTFESNAVKVEPYEVKKVKYVVSPPTANLTWTMNQSDDFFTYDATTYPPDKNGVGYVEIQGMKEGSGNLYCVTDGSAKGNLQVRVAWDYEFSLTGKTMFTIKPTETAEVGYKVNPSYSDITISSADDEYFTYNRIDNGDGTGKIIITPIAECADTITIVATATNPNNGDAIVGTKSISANFQYSKLTPTINLISQEGKYSEYDSANGVLKLGDGETVQLKFGIEEKSSTGRVSQVKFVPVDTKKTYATDTFVSNSSLYTLSDVQGDKITSTNQYRISKLYIPYKQKVTKENGSYSYGAITYMNWQTDLKWRAYYKKNGTECDDYFGIAQYSCYDGGRPSSNAEWWQGYFYDENGSTYIENNIAYYSEDYIWGRVEDISYRNTVMSEEEFCNYAWLYCPGTPNKQNQDLWVTYNDFKKGNLTQGAYGAGQRVNVLPHIMTQNVTATKEEIACTDTSLKESYLIGYMEITVEHLGKNQGVISIPVYYNVRYCSNQ